MATKIRLKRCGAKKQPQYRVIVVDERAPRDGRAIEEIGHHNPLTDPPTTTIDEERARYWLGVGAQPSETVTSLLRKAGILAPNVKAAPAEDTA
ncbi:MAG: 30S ribosomal protein S16 [candidate division WS1 bacterium]|nr:30S ribosomal protein S16 [candidate division WS1 bacterium]